MMSLRNWLALLVVYILYLLLGGYSFHTLENPQECLRNYKQKEMERDIKEKVDKILGQLDTSEKEEIYKIFEMVESEYEIDLRHTKRKFLPFSGRNSNETEPDPCFTWNLYNSIFFSFTAVTTIGYGHLSPSTDEGKIFCIFYSLIGVPINGILIGSLGTYFGSKLKTLTKNTKFARTEARKMLMLFLDVLLYLIPGVAIFLAIPAATFVAIENWSYLDSFYYAFITLTTIGFGDFVSGRDEEVLNRLGNWQIVYEIGLMVWIVFGLGYVFVVITVITDAMRTPARKAAKSFNAKSKVMLSRIMQELYLMGREDSDDEDNLTTTKKKQKKKKKKLERAQSYPTNTNETSSDVETCENESGSQKDLVHEPKTNKKKELNLRRNQSDPDVALATKVEKEMELSEDEEDDEEDEEEEAKEIIGKLVDHSSDDAIRDMVKSKMTTNSEEKVQKTNQKQKGGTFVATNIGEDDVDASNRKRKMNLTRLLVDKESLIHLNDLVQATQFLDPDLLLENNIPPKAEQNSSPDNFQRSISLTHPADLMANNTSLEGPTNKNNVPKSKRRASVLNLHRHHGHSHKDPTFESEVKGFQELNEILKNTSLAEFLVAAKKVRKTFPNCTDKNGDISSGDDSFYNVEENQVEHQQHQQEEGTKHSQVFRKSSFTQPFIRLFHEIHKKSGSEHSLHSVHNKTNSAHNSASSLHSTHSAPVVVTSTKLVEIPEEEKISDNEDQEEEEIGNGEEKEEFDGKKEPRVSFRSE